MFVRVSSTLLTVVAASASTSTAWLDYDFSGRGHIDAVESLLRRVLRLPDETLPFRLEMVNICASPRPAASKSDLCFELLQDADASPTSPAVVVRGTSAVDIARGAAHYLREFCNMSFSWGRSGGNQVERPASWPTVPQPVTQWRLRDISYGFNVCTFSYTQVWYMFNDSGFGDDWESLLDWMALSGINLALAYTGQEEVYRKVYQSLGVDEASFGAWSNGPAHLTWSRGQSMHGVGGPLPQSWMKQQWEMQRVILRRMRELGIVPILPAFQGNVPPLLKSLFPGANISLQQAHWGGGEAAWLDATDPLFGAIGDAFMKQLIADFGMDVDGDGVGDVTEHWYEADGYFSAGDAPWLSSSLGAREGSSSYSSAYEHARLAYGAMNRTDPEARWMYQGWILQSSSAADMMRGYVAAVPSGRFLVSDMWAEWLPISGMLAEAGVPYLYGVLQNFGGTLFLGMSVDTLNTGALEDPSAVPSVIDTFALHEGGVGIGAFPEGIDQNSAYFTFFFDTLWQAGPVDLVAWWTRYATQRYGMVSAAATEAWLALGATVYGIDERSGATEGGHWREKAKGGVLSSPLLYDESDTPSHAWYNASVVLGAWQHLLDFAHHFVALPETLRYDLVNVGREVLDRVADARAEALAKATRTDVASAGARMKEVQADADALLCSDESFTMSSWVRAARALGQLHYADTGDDLADFYDRMARAQVTTWLPACGNSSVASGVCSLHTSDTEAPPLEDYANKAWGGLVGHYYAGRVDCYLTHWSTSGVNVTAYHECVDMLALEFQSDADQSKFPLCTEEHNTLVLSTFLIAKYASEVHGLPTPQKSVVI